MGIKKDLKKVIRYIGLENKLGYKCLKYREIREFLEETHLNKNEIKEMANLKTWFKDMNERKTKYGDPLSTLKNNNQIDDINFYTHSVECCKIRKNKKKRC